MGGKRQFQRESRAAEGAHTKALGQEVEGHAYGAERTPCGWSLENEGKRSRAFRDFSKSVLKLERPTHPSLP